MVPPLDLLLLNLTLQFRLFWGWGGPRRQNGAHGAPGAGGECEFGKGAAAPQERGQGI